VDSCARSDPANDHSSPLLATQGASPATPRGPQHRPRVAQAVRQPPWPPRCATDFALAACAGRRHRDGATVMEHLAPQFSPRASPGGSRGLRWAAERAGFARRRPGDRLKEGRTRADRHPRLSARSSSSVPESSEAPRQPRRPRRSSFRSAGDGARVEGCAVCCGSGGAARPPVSAVRVSCTFATCPRDKRVGPTDQ